MATLQGGGPSILCPLWRGGNRGWEDDGGPEQGCHPSLQAQDLAHHPPALAGRTVGGGLVGCRCVKRTRGRKGEQEGHPRDPPPGGSPSVTSPGSAPRGGAADPGPPCPPGPPPLPPPRVPRGPTQLLSQGWHGPSLYKEETAAPTTPTPRRLRRLHLVLQEKQTALVKA